jgi:1-acyl-sn-glycerol-3-phosphate acyltransferase
MTQEPVEKKEYSLKYPRRRIFRTLTRGFGKIVVPLTANITVSGLENLPSSGPLILASNHTDILEIFLMLVYVPLSVEVLGAEDIPLRPPVAQFMPVVRYYGYIPIMRGVFDRAGLNMALDILKQDGVVGIFPQGGVWQQGTLQAHDGVAWLSQKGNAPVIPIGFGGTRGGLVKMLQGKRPRLSMRVGKPIPIVPADAPDRKALLKARSREIMEQIQALIPEEDKFKIEDERFEFSYTVGGEAGKPLENEIALAQLLSEQVLMDTFSKNLALKTGALQQLKTERDPAAIAAAIDALLAYLAADPQFLSYRFGYGVGAAMHSGLEALRAVCREAAATGAEIHIVPVRRYRDVPTGAEVEERYG